MAIACMAFLYLIFSPDDDKLKDQQLKLNDAVPQATDGGLPADKQKAYELALLEQKEKEKEKD
ncbi:hypothetical protein LWM68_15495 [Niabella sp. W65]|nr:hypothetical protein [Niabella sp. W65]MCH7364035.1 hypothetical protein [Niabella sp. W65]ULT39913.1 hypothetical protein KRR40_34295 [Niabella sp. I65]